MIIEKIETKQFREGEMIIVFIKECPNVQPVFNANITKEELTQKLKEWKINQDNIKNIIPTPKQETDISNIKTLEGCKI